MTNSFKLRGEVAIPTNKPKFNTGASGISFYDRSEWHSNQATFGDTVYHDYWANYYVKLDIQLTLLKEEIDE